MTGQEIAARARGMVGVRFRPQGRSWSGLDCVGLVAAAIGVRDVRADYQLRGGSVDELERELAAAGLVRVGEVDVGDVVVMRAGPEQLHLGIATEAGMVHADAGLRRVVERPGGPAWEVKGVWRAHSEPLAARPLHHPPSPSATADGPPPRAGED